MSSIKLVRGEFGHVSMLNAASDLVTHAHPEAHLIIWLDGDAGEITVGDRRFVPSAHRAIGVNSFEPHSHCFSPGGIPGSFLAFYLDPEWMTRRYGTRVGRWLFSDPELPVEPWLRDVALGLFERLDQCDAGWGGDDHLGAYEIEGLIDRFVNTRPAAATAPLTGNAAVIDFRVRKAVELMRGNLCGRMNFDELARSVGLSRPHFFALFKAQMKLTPNVYWNTLRMEEALRQLATSGESLTAVACNLGFTTQSNFTRFFRDHAGVPPIVYREAMRIAA